MATPDRTIPHKNGNTKKRIDPTVDPVYDIPILGPLVREADLLRTKMQGTTLTQREAEFLRAEARALRHLANYLETRAVQLERLVRERSGETPRVTKIRLDG